ncbi:MAG: hypothetical protein JRI25_20865 [Deltaproteobacteria bacterium]|nr:hypothetical protein [Deltaproteobacteria bacterium]
MPRTVAIVGLGTAGAAVAALCARRGLQVIGLERGPLGSAGARWVNAVPEWAFHHAGLAPSEPPELRDRWERVYLVAGWGPARVPLRGALAVDMRYLVERLQSLAEDAGADLRPGVAVHRFDGAGLETSNGRIEADVFVDASGLNGARLLDQPRVPAVDLCVATQQVRHLLDRDAARAFFHRQRARQGDTLVFAGVAGGYSIVEVRFDDEQVAVLTGSIPALGHPSGSALLEQFVAKHSWIGPPVFGGTRAIPLRRALPKVGGDRVAAIGDAAFQLYSAHGSGIAQQLVAAPAPTCSVASPSASRWGRCSGCWSVACWARKSCSRPCSRNLRTSRCAARCAVSAVWSASPGSPVTWRRSCHGCGWCSSTIVATPRGRNGCVAGHAVWSCILGFPRRSARPAVEERGTSQEMQILQAA